MMNEKLTLILRESPRENFLISSFSVNFLVDIFFLCINVENAKW